jgi:hydroxymethylglutaryl-CoA reductase (NADPH)
MTHKTVSTNIPTQWIGPLHFKTMSGFQASIETIEVTAPLATYETTLFHSVNRGAKITRLTQNLTTTLLSDHMTRSILLEAPNAYEASQLSQKLEQQVSRFQEEVVSKQSHYAKLKKIDIKQVSQLLYIRFAFETGDASGHNMTTFASDAIADLILKEHPEFKYISVSGNYCIDKKTSAVNSILGRGKSVIAEVTISRDLLKDVLRTTPEKMVELNIKKNMIGSIAAGSLMSSNAHFANMLLAFYLATGQDAANIVEGSQGITYCEVKDDALYFSVTLPNIIVGMVGHGKDTLDAHDHLKQLKDQGIKDASMLAQLCAGIVLCGELSLLAALTNPHELTSSHQRIERKAS